jgi:hypothetical protein
MTTTAGSIFLAWQQMNNVNVNTPLVELGRENGITRVGGGDGNRLDVVVAVSRRLIQTAKGDDEPPAYHWTHFVLSPLFDLQSSGGGSRNNLFWLY